jgi:hypothetical protein
MWREPQTASAGSLDYVGSRRAAISPVRAWLLQPTSKTGENSPEESIDEDEAGKGERPRSVVESVELIRCHVVRGRNGPQRRYLIEPRGIESLPRGRLEPNTKHGARSEPKELRAERMSLGLGLGIPCFEIHEQRRG